MCNVTDVLWPQCRIHLDHFYKPSKKYLPSAGNHATRSGTNCLFKQRGHQGAKASTNQNLEGSFLSHVPPKLSAREDGRLKEQLGYHTGALLLLPKADTSLVSAPGCPAENEERRHTGKALCEAKVLPTVPLTPAGTLARLPPAQHKPRVLLLHHTPGYTNRITDVSRQSLPLARAEVTLALEFCSPSPSASHTQHQKIYYPQ